MYFLYLGSIYRDHLHIMKIVLLFLAVGTMLTSMSSNYVSVWQKDNSNKSNGIDYPKFRKLQQIQYNNTADYKDDTAGNLC